MEQKNNLFAGEGECFLEEYSDSRWHETFLKYVFSLLFKQDGECLGPVEMWEMMLIKNLKVSWDGHPRCTSFFAFPPGNRTKWCLHLRNIPMYRHQRNTIHHEGQRYPGLWFKLMSRVCLESRWVAGRRLKKKKGEMVSWSAFSTKDWEHSLPSVQRQLWPLFPHATLEGIIAPKMHHFHTHTLHGNVRKTEHPKSCPQGVAWFSKLNVSWCDEMNGICSFHGRPKLGKFTGRTCMVCMSGSVESAL